MNLLKEIDHLIAEADKTLFRVRARTPLEWLRKGDCLKRAADMVRIADCDALGCDDVEAVNRRHAMLPMYKFLAGLAIENYAKGAILAVDEKRTDNGKIEWKDAGNDGHDCRRLVEIAGIDVSPDECNLLDRMT